MYGVRQGSSGESAPSRGQAAATLTQPKIAMLNDAMRWPHLLADQLNEARRLVGLSRVLLRATRASIEADRQEVDEYHAELRAWQVTLQRQVSDCTATNRPG